MLFPLPSVRSVIAVAVALVVFPAVSGCLLSDDPSEDAVAPKARVPEVREFDVYLANGGAFVKHAPRAGVIVPQFMFSFDPDGPGSVPGPEIRVTEGDLVRVRFHDVDEHTIHWHGVRVPWASDGVPFMTQTLGVGVYTYEFVAKDAGTYWYHCHVDAPIHVDLGLFGAFIVEPAEPASDPAYDREATLILHETDSRGFSVATAALIDPEYATTTPTNPADLPDHLIANARTTTDIAALTAGAFTGVYAAGSVGPRDYYPFPSVRYFPSYDVFMINGKSFPETEPVTISSGETLRVRLVNAGQLVHSMHLHGHKFLVTHKDGSKLASPYLADTLLIGPAERYDIYVEGDNPGVWDFHDHGGSAFLGAHAANDHAYPGGMSTMLVYEDFEHPALPTPATATSGDYMLFAKEARGAHAHH